MPFFRGGYPPQNYDPYFFKKLLEELKEAINGIDLSDFFSIPVDSNGDELFTDTNPGIVDARIQDQTTEIIDLHLSARVQELDIAVATSLYDTTVTVTTAAEPTDDNIVCFKEGTNFYQGTILSHSANGGNWDVNLDTPLDFAYTTDGGCSERTINLAVDGSTTPVVFKVSPSNLTPGTEWDIVRIMGSITDATAMDDAKFGGMTALTKGIVVRTVDGIVKNIFNAKTNADLKHHMYDVVYSDKAPAGSNGLNFRRTFGGQSKNGVVVRLTADTSDSLEVVIQDNLTALDTFYVIAQGHIVD